MAGMLRVQRSRGAFSGVLLVLLGIWGGLIPFVGPYVSYAYTPDRAWVYTSGRFWLELLPAVGTVLGGLILLASRLRPTALFGAWLAALSGCWFAIGGTLAPLWTHAQAAQGTPVGGPVARAVEEIGFFAGLGVAIVFVATLALGRLSVVAVRDLKAAEPAVTPATQPAVAEPRPQQARWTGRAAAGPTTGNTATADTAPGTASRSARPAPAMAVLTPVFPAKAGSGDTSEPTTTGARRGKHSADGDTGSGQAEVSSGAAQR